MSEGYALVERDAAYLAGQDYTPWRIVKEIGEYARRNTAPTFGNAVSELLFDINRAATREARLERTLKELLHALHARPLFGGPLLGVEEAIANANELLDSRSEPEEPTNDQQR